MIRSIAASILVTYMATTVFAAEPATRPAARDDRANWTKVTLDKTFRSEGVAVADVNRDGKEDVLAGDVWYEAPDWKMHELRKAGVYDWKNGYSTCFQNFAADVNGDGWPDSIIIGMPADAAYWYANPRGEAGEWKAHKICDNACNESPAFADLLGDGHPLPVLPSKGRMCWFLAQKDAAAPWLATAISDNNAPGTQQFSHGMGVGDINGDGRNDVLVKEGWWEAPENRTQGSWTFHPANLGEDCAHMLVYDVDGDGLNDVITSSAHRYGIWWFQQVRTDNKIEFKRHDIAPHLFSQSHGMVLTDINGDGLPDFVVGKRFYAHNGKADPDEDAPAVLYWFELTRPAKGEVRFIPHLIDDDSGVGTQFTIGYINSDKPAIVTSNKKGVHIFLRKDAH